MPSKQEGSEDDVQQLKAKVAELEAALKREQNRKEPASAVGDSMRETMNRAMDEYSKWFRGLTSAYLESVRVAAETAGTFANAVQTSNPVPGPSGAPTATVGDQVRNLGSGCTSAFTDAVNNMIDIPRRSVDKFYESYGQSKTT
jgi:hypothetical protein